MNLSGTSVPGVEDREPVTGLTELQAAALEAAVDAIVITDRKATILWVNAAFEQLTGYSRQEAIGQSTRLLKSGQHPAAFYKNMWDTILSEHKWQGELANRRKDGSVYWEEMTITPVRDPAGEIGHFVAIQREITERKRLREHAYLLAQAVENSSELIGVADPNGYIIFSNRALQQALGYSADELRGKQFGIFLSGHNPAGLNEEIGTQSYQGSGWRGECLVPREDGSDLLVFLSTSRIKDADGLLLGVLGIARDITETKRTQGRMRLLARAVEGSSELVAMTDAGLQITFANRALLRALHYEKEEDLLGKPISAIMSPRNVPELFPEIAAATLERGEWTGECLHLRVDGTEYPIQLTTSVVKDAEGRPIGTLGIAKDITQHKRDEEKLRASEAQFRQLAENIREVFFVCEPDPVRMTFISRAYDEVWGRPRQELYERPAAWIESAHPDDREAVGASFARCLQGIQSELEYRVVRPDNSVRSIHARVFPVHDAAGKFVRLVGIAEDVTARKQRDGSLAEAHERLNAALMESERQAREAAKLTELVDILQSCQTAEEAYKITESALQTTLTARSGSVCITSASRNVVEAVASWGAGMASEKTFQPDDCWALRRGKIHRVQGPDSPLRCGHVGALPPDGYLCVPMAAQGETLGVLYLEYPPASLDAATGLPGDSVAALDRQAPAVAERISLALANLQLREALRRQSIRDALTGLFNRRFMEETLEREMGRAARNNQPVALIMLDIDHFKRFNDTYGHQAGDTLLRALGDFLKQRTRGQDVACRYGGEEFAFILSGATVESARKRVEILREELKLLQVPYAGQLLGAITLSIGIAAFPTHASETTALLRAADEALYRAKKAGRDRIVTA